MNSKFNSPPTVSSQVDGQLGRQAGLNAEKINQRIRAGETVKISRKKLEQYLMDCQKLPERVGCLIEYDGKKVHLKPITVNN